MKFTFSIPKKLDLSKPHTWLASWFGCGFISPAPGTWGSLGAIPFGFIILAGGGPYTLLAATILITAIGLWAAHHFDKDMDGHDSKMIVIDEVAGQWIALIPTALSPLLILISFIAFRAFDIKKPWPISHIDQNVKGAAGVMGDDILAGICAAFCVYLLSFLIL